MRRGRVAIVRRGPYKGDELSVDHIIPRSVVPELDNVMANLELMPLRMNESKNAKIGQRQRALAQKFYEAGLLSKEGLKAVQDKPHQAVRLAKPCRFCKRSTRLPIRWCVAGMEDSSIRGHFVQTA